MQRILIGGLLVCGLSGCGDAQPDTQVCAGLQSALIDNQKAYSLSAAEFDRSNVGKSLEEMQADAIYYRLTQQDHRIEQNTLLTLMDAHGCNAPDSIPDQLAYADAARHCVEARGGEGASIDSLCDPANWEPGSGLGSEGVYSPLAIPTTQGE